MSKTAGDPNVHVSQIYCWRLNGENRSIFLQLCTTVPVRVSAFWIIRYWVNC